MGLRTLDPKRNAVGQGQLPGGGLMAGVDEVIWRLGMTRHEGKWLLQMAGPLTGGKTLGIGFCGPIECVLKTHLDLMMNVKMFLVYHLIQTCLEESLLK